MNRRERHDFLSYLSVNPTRHNILGAIARRACAEPPLDFAPDEIHDELHAAGQEIYRSQIGREFEALGAFGLITICRNGRQLGGRFEAKPSALPFWQAVSGLAEATEAMFPPGPES